MKTITTSEGRTYKRVSRWIHIKTEYVTKRHSLSDYADFYSSEDGKGVLTYFKHDGRLYAIGQFMRLSYPEFFEDENGKQSFLSGYDCTDYYNPLMIEIEDGGEYCRLYQIIE